MLNALTSKITGTDTRIDFSSLAPLDMYGFYEVLTELWTSSLGESLANTPALSLLIGHNPRVTDAYKGAARFFHLMDDDTESPEDFAQVMEGFASISSGYSNYMKFDLAQQTARKLSSTGKAHEISGVESWFLLFGLPPQEETLRRITDNKSYAKSKEFKDNFDHWYKENKRVMAKKGVANQDTEFQERMINKALMHFRGYPERFNEMLLAALARDAKEGDNTLYASATRNMGMMTEGEFKDWISTAPMPEETKAQLKTSMEMIQRFRDEE